MERLDRRNDDLVPVGKMPDDHILDLPILFHGIPHFAQVLPVFVRDDANNTESVKRVMEFVDTLGFDPLPVGTLKDSRILESGGAAFGANLAYDQLRQLVEVEISG